MQSAIARAYPKVGGTRKGASTACTQARILVASPSNTRRTISLAFRQRQMLLPPAARHREFDRRNMDTVAVSVLKVSRSESNGRQGSPREISNSEKQLITKLHNDVMAALRRRANVCEPVHGRSQRAICIMHDNFTVVEGF